LMDGILELLLAELGERCHVIATGGLGPMIGTGSKYIKTVDESLTLEGLRIIWERNVPGGKELNATKLSARIGGKAAQSKLRDGDVSKTTPEPRTSR